MIEKINDWHPAILNVIAFGISLTEIEVIMKITILLIAGGYSVWRWQYEWRNTKKK